jgi:hypothetical protein
MKKIIIVGGLLCAIAFAMYFIYTNNKSEVATVVTDNEPIPVDTIPDENTQTEPIIEPDEITNPRTPATPPNIVVTPPANKTCYVGGCSSQLCTDKPDMVSTCEWREAYACYQTATCAVQPDGECGWTETNELNACLANANE